MCKVGIMMVVKIIGYDVSKILSFFFGKIVIELDLFDENCKIGVW